MPKTRSKCTFLHNIQTPQNPSCKTSLKSYHHNCSKNPNFQQHTNSHKAPASHNPPTNHTGPSSNTNPTTLCTYIIPISTIRSQHSASNLPTCITTRAPQKVLPITTISKRQIPYNKQQRITPTRSRTSPTLNESATIKHYSSQAPNAQTIVRTCRPAVRNSNTYQLNSHNRQATTNNQPQALVSHHIPPNIKSNVEDWTQQRWLRKFNLRHNLHNSNTTKQSKYPNHTNRTCKAISFKTCNINVKLHLKKFNTQTTPASKLTKSTIKKKSTTCQIKFTPNTYKVFVGINKYSVKPDHHNPRKSSKTGKLTLNHQQNRKPQISNQLSKAGKHQAHNRNAQYPVNHDEFTNYAQNQSHHTKHYTSTPYTHAEFTTQTTYQSLHPRKPAKPNLQLTKIYKITHQPVKVDNCNHKPQPCATQSTCNEITPQTEMKILRTQTKLANCNQTNIPREITPHATQHSGCKQKPRSIANQYNHTKASNKPTPSQHRPTQAYHPKQILNHHTEAYEYAQHAKPNICVINRTKIQRQQSKTRQRICLNRSYKHNYKAPHSTHKYKHFLKSLQLSAPIQTHKHVIVVHNKVSRKNRATS
eukprot:gene3384-2338_t